MTNIQISMGYVWNPTVGIGEKVKLFVKFKRNLLKTSWEAPREDKTHATDHSIRILYVGNRGQGLKT